MKAFIYLNSNNWRLAWQADGSGMNEEKLLDVVTGASVYWLRANIPPSGGQRPEVSQEVNELRLEKWHHLLKSVTLNKIVTSYIAVFSTN